MLGYLYPGLAPCQSSLEGIVPLSLQPWLRRTALSNSLQLSLGAGELSLPKLLQAPHYCRLGVLHHSLAGFP